MKQNEPTTTEIVKCILMLSWAQYLLAICDLHPWQPIALICDTPRLSKRIINALSSQYSKVGVIEELTTETLKKSSRLWPVIFFGCSRENLGKREEQRIRRFVDVAKRGLWWEKGEDAYLIVGIFDKHIPQIFRNDFFKIYLREESGLDEDEIKGFLAKLMHHAILPRYELDRIALKHEQEQPMLAAFKIAADIVALVNPETDTSRAAYVSESLVILDEESADTSDVVELFLDILFDKAEAGELRIHELPNLERYQIDLMGSSFFENSTGVYVAESYFSRLIEELKAIFPVDVIKRTLVEEGVIFASNEATYTTKMRYTNPFGQDMRVRMIKLDKDRLKRPGKLSFCETCRLNSMEEMKNREVER